MRILGLGAVCLSLLFGAGGVVSRPLADTGGDGAVTRAPAQAEPRDPAAPAARPLEPGEIETAQDELDSAIDQLSRADSPAKSCGALPVGRPIRIDMSHVEVPKGFVSLNRTGYNYRQPGDPPQFLPDSTGKRVPPELRE